MKIQQLTVHNPESRAPVIEITISNEPVIVESTIYLTGRVKVGRSGTSFENLELDALEGLQALIDKASEPIRQTLREMQ